MRETDFPDHSRKTRERTVPMIHARSANREWLLRDMDPALSGAEELTPREATSYFFALLSFARLLQQLRRYPPYQTWSHSVLSRPLDGQRVC